MRLHGHQNDFQSGGPGHLRLGIGEGKTDEQRYYLKRLADQCPRPPPSVSMPLNCCTILSRF